MIDKQIDCTALQCPMPVVKISQAIKDMEVGQTLAVDAADPAFGLDIQAWVATTGHELLAFAEGDVQHALIRKTKIEE